MHGKSFASLDISRPDAQLMPAAAPSPATGPAAAGAAAPTPAPALAAPVATTAPFVQFSLQSTAVARTEQ